jgi:hypothetical protein
MAQADVGSDPGSGIIRTAVRHDIRHPLDRSDLARTRGICMNDASYSAHG